MLCLTVTYKDKHFTTLKKFPLNRVTVYLGMSWLGLPSLLD